MAAGRTRAVTGLYADGLEPLARRHEQAKRWPEAIRYAERLVAHDPLREEGHRLLMRACQAAGDRSRAVRAYHVCAAAFERELGIVPSAKTRAVYEAVLHTVRGRSDLSAATPPFVGRVAELGRLRSVWREAAAGRAQMVLVSGEPGVGKTRLVNELRAGPEAVMVGARAYAAEGPIAYGLAIGWLRSQPIAARLSRSDRAELTELARLLPELSERVPSPEPLSEPELRRRLFGASPARWSQPAHRCC